MARREIKSYEITDDLDGAVLSEEDVKTIKFSYGGSAYTIDLSKKNAQVLNEFMTKYIDAAQEASRNRSSVPKKKDAPREYGPVRTWTAENGFELNPKGRIPKKVLEAYDAAH